MVEQILPLSEKDTLERQKLIGVALFVVDEYGNALVFQNNQTKEETQKIRGQLTVPAETLEKGERLSKDLLPRTISEEVGKINDPKPIYRGLIHMDLPNVSIGLVCLEVPTIRSAVEINPKDSQEVSHARWVPLADIDSRTMRIGKWDVPLFRSPLQEGAQNILIARSGNPYPQFRKVSAPLPAELFEFLKQNPGPIHPVE
jgi:hypothetical protein